MLCGALGLCAVAPLPARAADPLGLYIGAASGQADVRDSVDLPPLYKLEPHHIGWEAFVGMRPLSVLAAELEYIDLGHPSSQNRTALNSNLYSTQTADVHQRAATASALIYAPLPLPSVDLFGKVGVAHLQSSGTATRAFVCTGGICPPVPFITPFSFSDDSNRLIYGVGVQLRAAALAVRLEYQRISLPGGDPDLLSPASGPPNIDATPRDILRRQCGSSAPAAGHTGLVSTPCGITTCP